ncbi:MAG TPA: AMIN domain-containing protein [Terriglobales bacterium]|nr:AMIN domain-containing protein [Terriglobales bacterium]
MHWRPFIAVFLISLACGSRLAAQSSTPAETAGSKPAITNIRIVSESQALTIEVSTNSPAIPDTERLENPDRIVFDFPGFVMQSPAQHLNVNHGPITGVRASLFQANPPLSRIVLDLKEPVSIELQPMEDKVLIRIPFDKPVSDTVEKAIERSSPSPSRDISQKPVKRSAPSSLPAAQPTIIGPQPTTSPAPAPVAASSAPTSMAPANKSTSEYDTLSKARAITLAELPSLEEKAQAGDPQAQTMLALAYHAGVLLKNDEEEAFRLLKLAAEKGYVPAEESLGIYYSMGVGMDNPDLQAALKWYTAAAQKGSLDAATNIGSMYASGDGVTKDMTTAIRWFRQAADAGGGAAAYNLALIYKHGDGVPRDEQQAISWLTKAADLDFIPAVRDVGIRAAYPRDGSAPNMGVAIVRLKRGAALGDAISQALVGDIYCDIKLGIVDYQQAAKYYKMAADQGQRDGEFGLAVRYVTGQGVPKDDGEGLRWFKAAADQGHADAQYDLGTMYEIGQGTEADLPLAVYYYKLAAQQGVVKAQYRLGILLTKGPGIEPDRVSAYKWFMLSQDSVKSSATELNELRHSMSPAEIAEAERQVDAWRTEHKQPHN